MKYILTIGVVSLVPLLSHAHDGEHVVYTWYKDPHVVALSLGTLLVLTLLAYAIAKKSSYLVITPVLVLLIAMTTYVGFSTMNPSDSEAGLTVANFGNGQAVTLYKSPTCGCCSGHAAALEEVGFSVTIEEMHDLSTVKRSHNIPSTGESCHTAVIGDYVVEGHVPLEAIEKLLAEKPDIAGIGLAGMPIGTPGMPGRKIAPYEVYQLSDSGEMSPYLTL